MDFSFKDTDLERLMQKYSAEGPYYTSYPSLSEWREGVQDTDFLEAINSSSNQGNSFKVYVHFPYCDKQCYFCICNATVTKDKGKISKFIEFNQREIAILKRLLDSNGHNLRISEIHFGGGSPNIMDYGDFNNFFDNVLSFGDTSILEEVVIEVDVRTVDEDKLKHYKEKGINRLSFGIQDFDPKVQKAINRTQSLELVERLLRPDLRRGFKSVNFDLGD